MVKRKTTAEDAPPKQAKRNEEESSDESDTDMLDVDFEWFDPQPAVDFHGLKTLLRQLFDVDNQLFDLSALADLILSQPLLGSTVKTDGNESDPFAFLSVLNLHTHRDKPVVQDLIKYLVEKSQSSAALSPLPSLLTPDSSAQVGLILTERFINMPSEIVTPMYTMLQEEIQWALDAAEPYAFTHYLILSKTYTEVASKLDAEENRPQKKNKAKVDSSSSVFYFHPEDEALHRNALGFCNYDYTTKSDEGAADAKRTFQEMGIRPQGHMTLIEAARFADSIQAVGQYLSTGQ